MTDHDVNLAADERLDPVVERAAALLRRPEPVRQAWRDELLASVAPPARTRRVPMRVWVPVGIAAAVSATVGVQRVSARGGGDDQVLFTISAPSAKRVSLVGDFNGWNPAAVPMRRGGAGDVWVVNVRLQPGRHVFAFSVDGALRADSAAPRAVEDDFGVPGSVVVVPGRGTD